MRGSGSRLFLTESIKKLCTYAKVCKFGVPKTVQENVAGLYVSVDFSCVMKILEAHKYRIAYCSYLLFIKCSLGHSNDVEN